MRIYFDNASTTAVSETAALKALSVMTREFANPSSIHRLGAEMEREMRASAQTIAAALSVRQEEIIFTSGGTEANNLAILGAARANARAGRHVVTSAAEHPSVERAFDALADDGFAVTKIPVHADGSLLIEDILRELRQDTILVSLMHVNNETGVIWNIADFASQIKKRFSRLLIHCDGVQGFCKHALRLQNIDMYSMSGHKIHGPKGVGALYIKKGTKIKPLLFGGGQQNGTRPGTENTPGICGMAAAVDQIRKKPDRMQNIFAIHQILRSLAHEMDGVFINGADVNATSPYILNMSFTGVKGETLTHALEQEEIYISTGAACSSRHRDKNVLARLGRPAERLPAERLSAERLSAERVDSAVRFSFSDHNTIEEAHICKEAIMRIVPRLRLVSL